MSSATDSPAELAAVLQQLRPERLAELLQQAIVAPSPTYDERAAIEVFDRALRDAGFEPRLQSIGREHWRGNLLVELGPGTPALLLVGHLDVIPFPETHPACQQLERRGDRIYGTGSADMKGGCAAMVEALTAVASAGVALRRGVRLALTVGEEDYGDGASALISSELSCPVAVIGEPTGLAVCFEHRGYLELLLTVDGRLSHASLPELGKNAIEALASWIEQLRAFIADPPLGDVAVNLRCLTGGDEALFVVADRCEAILDVHFPPRVDAERIEQRIAMAGQQLAAERGLSVDIGRLFHASGYRLDADDPALAPLRRAIDREQLAVAQQPFRSHSDGNLLRRAGSRPLICGPGALEVAHTPDEHVGLAEVQRAARFYATAIYEACIAAEASS
jgi:acetylornithine deacetylase